jgi:peptidoglycan/xylan/chitin deacetylase (PgdA/CDA1 family)
MRLRALLAAAVLFFATLRLGHTQTGWVGSWSASQQRPEPNNSLAGEDLHDTTLRQIVHLPIGGEEVRIHLSNRFGISPLHFTSVHIARPMSATTEKIVAATDKALTFSGSTDVTLPPGADYISDPVAFPLAALSNLAVTLHADLLPSEQTGHPGSRATSYLAHGNLVSAPYFSDAKKVEHWYFISAVDVVAPSRAAAIVILGDSITDGHGATTDGNNRWPDLLARRLQTTPDMEMLAVLNQGVGGNRLLLDGLGQNALARFDHDVLGQAGVRYLVVLEGINDIGMLEHDGTVTQADHDALVHRIFAAYEHITMRAHTHGIKVIGCTILPYAGSSFYHPGPSNEADRQTINKWIRSSSHFDAVIDFDSIIRNPEYPDHLLPTFDSGDHLHPSLAGYEAMAQAVPLSLFTFNSSGLNSPFSALRIALTFDDLPAHSELPSGMSRLEVASKIIASLRDARVPPVYGFVNGSRIDEQPADAAVLRAWRAAGYPLGNHTWSHMNLNQHSLEDFEVEVSRNEPLLNASMKDEDWHWFRFPFLAEGDTPAKRAGIRTFLLRNGYRIAGVTMSFGDYQWNEPYARCTVKGDGQAIASLEHSYLAAADQNINYYRGLSQTLAGRDIPYVLLMHIGAFDAEMLPQLLNLYRSKGFQFVTLEEAEGDEFYRQDIDLSLPPVADTLEGAIADRHLSLPSPATASPQFDALCR